MGIMCLCGLLTTSSFALEANPAAKQTAQSQPAQKPASTAPASPTATPQKPAPPANAPVVVCPAGQHAVKQSTPFGSMDACVADEAAPAQPPASTQPPSNTPAAPPAAAPAGGNVSTTQGAQPATAPPATGAPAPEQKPAEGEKKTQELPANENAVALNLENADLYQVLRIIGSELKINYIVDPAVKGTVTINTSASVNRAELFNLLQMILAINGAAAVKSNGYYSIVPLGSAKQQPMNFHYAKEAEEGALPEDAFTLMVVPMRFMSATEMSKILTPFMSPAGQIVVQDKGNIMLITDSSTKLRQLAEIVKVFDDPVIGRQRVHLFPVANNLAQNLVPELKSVFAGYGLSTGSSAIQFVPMDRLNSILAISPSPEIFAEVEEWIKKLDQPAHDAGMRNFIYKVQNAKASELKDILGSLYSAGASPVAQAPTQGQAQSQPTGTSSENPATVMGPTSGMAAPSGAAPKSGANTLANPFENAGAVTAGPAATLRMQSDVRIMADDRNNVLIIQATQHDYDSVLRTVQELDTLPKQVMIDARIYEVQLTGDLTFGLSAFLDKTNNLANPNITTNGSFSSTAGFVAQTFAILHNSYQLQLFLTASENRSRVRTLSSPSILVTDNTPARIQVGAEVPVPVGSALTPVQSGGTSIFAQTIQFRDTGVILTVTPRINASGVVTLNLAQEVSSAQPNTTGVSGAPQINKSQFQTTVMLQDGQTLALGGIITESTTNSRNRIPLLGDIPGIGMLFGQTTLNKSRTELVLLITPHVAQDIPQTNAMTDDLVGRMKAMKKDLRKVVPPAR